MMKTFTLTALMLATAFFTDSCGSSGESTAPDPSTGKQIVELSTAELIVGKWRMIAEEPADGKGGIFKQERRLLELKADGTCHVENYMTARDDTWKLDGDTLMLREVRGEIDKTRRIQVEKVDDETLVLVEDLPEPYVRDGPQRKVRNTYRRVSESPLGPMLGKKVVTSMPNAGAYTASYDFRMSKLPTMEISIGRTIKGRAKLELKKDGSVEGCFGVSSHRSFSESKYSSSDGKHHNSDNNDRWLVGVRGKWERKKDTALVRLSRSWRNTCDISNGEGGIMGPIELECTAIAPNEKLPVTTLACRMIKDQYMLKKVAINPADTERAGPFTLQQEPRGRISTDHGKPWLFLGAAPGLEVKSEDGRRTSTPVVTFTSNKIDFVERNFIPKERKPDQ